MNRVKNPFKGILKNIWFGMKTSFLASKRYFLLKCVMLLSTTAIPLITIWLWKEILNGIGNAGARNTVFFYLMIYLFLQLAVALFSRFGGYINTRYRDELLFYIDGVMIEKVSRMDLSFFDSATMGDKVRHARSNFDIMADTTWLVFNIVSEVVNIAATLLIVCAYKWWIGLATVVLLVPFAIYNRKYNDRRLKMEKEQLRDGRRQDYYSSVFFDNDVQFEIKLYDIGHYFMDRYREIWKRLYRMNKREDIRHGIANSLILLLNLSSELMVLILSVADVMAGGIGIGDLQYNLSMVARLRSQAGSLMTDEIGRAHV